MKLKEYFHHQKHAFLTDNEKFLLYQRVVAQRDTNIKKSFLHRYVFAKRIAYASFVAILLFVVYGVHFFRDDIRYMTNSLIVQRGGDLVQAGYIAQIMQFDGSFVIEHNGKTIQTSFIRDGDLVSLRSGTQMIFHINDQTKAQITGPAQFILKTEDREDAYTIELLQGDFIEIQSLQEQTTQEIALVSSDLTIRQEKAENASHFQLTREGNIRRIDNKGADIRVVHAKTEQDIALAARQTLNLAANDITLIDNETQIARVLVQKDITQTVAFVDVENKSGVLDEVSVAALSQAFNTSDISVSEDVVSSVISTMGAKDDKRVVDPEQNNQLRSVLHDTFLMQDIQSIYEAYFSGDEQLLQRNLSSLQAKIALLYKSFGLPDIMQKEVDSQSFDQTVKYIQQLVMQLEQSYYIPPRYVHNLQVLIRRFDYIQGQSFGSQNEFDAREVFKKNIPNNLRFQ